MAPKGKYFTLKNKSSKLFLTVKDDNNNAGTLVVLEKKRDGDSQLWYTHPLTKTIRSKASHLCLDLNGDNRLVVNAYQAGEENQQWAFNKAKKAIENVVQSERALQIVSDDDGAEVTANEFIDKGSQEWKLACSPPKYFFIRSEICDKVASVDGGTSEAGGNVTLRPKDTAGPDHQLWYEDCYGNVRSKLSEKLVLDASSGKFETGHYEEGKDRVYWVIDEKRIVNKFKPQEVFDLADFVTGDGNQILPWNNNGGKNQLWNFDYIADS